MFAVNYTNLRDNMKACFDRVTEDCDTMIVTRKSENVVVMSQSSYDNLMETVYLVGNNNNYSHLMKSISEHKAGKGIQHDIIEVTDENNLDE